MLGRKRLYPGGIMSDDTMHHSGDPALSDALQRFERAEAELEETEERRRRLADEAAKAAAELDSTLDHAIRKSIDERDRLEEELAVVADHISRLESIRARSAGRNGRVTVTAAPQLSEMGEESSFAVAEGAETDESADYVSRWSELTKSRDGDTALSS
jgi:septal ring factor EnvC (AmiA/AmiB activator)